MTHNELWVFKHAFVQMGHIWDIYGALDTINELEVGN